MSRRRAAAALVASAALVAGAAGAAVAFAVPGVTGTPTSNPAAAPSGGPAAAKGPGGPGAVGPGTGVSNFGRRVAPIGRVTRLGNFPTGAALTPDGRFVWTVSTGRGLNDVRIVRTADGRVVQTIALPGASGGVAIAPDGRHAWVSGLRSGTFAQTPKPTIGAAGDVIHVFALDRRSGAATEDPAPIAVPAAPAAPNADSFPPSPARQSWPSGLAVTRDSRTLLAALNLSERVAVIDAGSKSVTQLTVRDNGKAGDRAYPVNVAVDPTGKQGWVTNEGDGSVAVFNVPARGNLRRATPDSAPPFSIAKAKTHPTAVALDPTSNVAYVSQANADRVLALSRFDPAKVLGSIDVGRPEGVGTSPVGLAVTRDGATLFVANSGEDAVRVIALRPRTITRPRPLSAADRRRIARVKPRRARARLRARLLARRTVVARVAKYGEIARLRSGLYPTQVMVNASQTRLYVVNGKGDGVGPNPSFDTKTDDRNFGYLPNDVNGTLQTVALPRRARDRDLRLYDLGRGARDTAVPVNRMAAPPGTPLVGAQGGPSDQIKYVFYVVKENRTYDQVLGDLPVGAGDPCLTLFGATRKVRTRRDGGPCPDARDAEEANLRTPGQRMDGTPITPNQHKIVRQFALLDHLYANSEVSIDGHFWTAGAYTSDYVHRNWATNYASRGRPYDFGVYPVTWPPRGFLFDAAQRQGVSYFNYGEAVAGVVLPDPQATPEERQTRTAVIANSEYAERYPSSAAIDEDIVSGPSGLKRTVYDADRTVNPATEISRMAFFRRQFAQQVAQCATPADPATCRVPQFNYLVLPNNHGVGTSPGRRTPDAFQRDGDQATGQLLDTLSHSKIWPHTAVFVVEDDAQNGADHVDAHRIPALVASPYAKHGVVVGDRYDQLSVIRTIELILGMKPVSIFDALATPMWNAFQRSPDNTPYQPVDIPLALQDEKNPQNAPLAALSKSYSWRTDQVPETEVNRILWAYRYGAAATPPPPGPNASGLEVDDTGEAVRLTDEAQAEGARSFAQP